MVQQLNAIPQAIIFDWDNTLVDTWPTIHTGLVETFIQMGHEPWSLEDIKAGRGGIHRSLRESFPEIFGDRWEEAKKIYHTTFAKIHLERLSPLSGAEDLLKFLVQQDFLVMVVSNKTSKYLRMEIEALQWGHYFHSIVGALDAEKDKPDPAPVHLALKGTNIVPSEKVWFIGDSQTDIQCALNSTCQPIFFTGNTDDKAIKPNQDNVCHMTSYDELQQLLTSLAS